MPVLQPPAQPVHEIPGARFTTLASPSCGSAETSVWMLELHAASAAVPHRLTREEIFVALDGKAIATLDGAVHLVHPGDTLAVPPGVEFTLTLAGGGPFRALVCLPVGGQAIVADGPPFTPPWAE